MYKTDFSIIAAPMNMWSSVFIALIYFEVELYLYVVTYLTMYSEYNLWYLVPCLKHSLFTRLYFYIVMFEVLKDK